MSANTFGRRLRVARAAAGLSCAELGQRVGVSAQSINKMEMDKMMPRSSVFVAICEQCRVSMDWMMDAREFDFITRAAPKTQP